MATTTLPQHEPLTEDRRGPVVVFKNVSITFDSDRPVLDNLSFTVERGQQLIILGPAGTGKSVLLKLVDGLLEPDSGTVEVFGQCVTSMRERDRFKLRARIGMVFQESALFDSLNVEDNVAYRLNEDRIPHEESHHRVEEVLNFVALPTAITKFPSELSGGMRRRVGVARAIITQPEVLLYDSPTGGLDPITSTTIIELIMKQRDVYKTSALLVSHRLQDGFMLASHHYDPQAKHMKPLEGAALRNVTTTFIVLKDGKVIFDGSAQELGHTDNSYIREYIS